MATDPTLTKPANYTGTAATATTYTPVADTDKDPHKGIESAMDRNLINPVVPKSATQTYTDQGVGDTTSGTIQNVDTTDTSTTHMQGIASTDEYAYTATDGSGGVGAEDITASAATTTTVSTSETAVGFAARQSDHTALKPAPPAKKANESSADFTSRIAVYRIELANWTAATPVQGQAPVTANKYTATSAGTAANVSTATMDATKPVQETGETTEAFAARNAAWEARQAQAAQTDIAKPIKGTDETDEAFAARTATWEAKQATAVTQSTVAPTRDQYPVGADGDAAFTAAKATFDSTQAKAMEADLYALADGTKVQDVADTWDVAEDDTLVEKRLEKLMETGEGEDVPMFAKPALAAAEKLLAARGLGKSSVAKEAIMNAILTTALPIAQQDASSQHQTFMKGLDFAQTQALKNAEMQYGLDVSKLTYEQQRELSNSKFAQTISVTNLNNKQQATIQNALSAVQQDLANLTNQQQAQMENAKAFLQVDLSNLSNEQQSAVINSQNEQQALISDQAATNASLQFNATSQNQTDQFMTNLSATIDRDNAARADAMSQFNAAEANKTAATNVGNDLEAAKFNEQMEADIAKYYDQLEFNKEQFNVQNANVIEQANTQWRRQVSTANTAGQNQANQSNALQAFNLSNQALGFIWQEARDAAAWAHQSSESDKEAISRRQVAVLGNESKEAIASAGYTYDMISDVIGGKE